MYRRTTRDWNEPPPSHRDSSDKELMKNNTITLVNDRSLSIIANFGIFTINADAILNSLLFILSGFINQLGLGCLRSGYSDGSSIYCYVKAPGQKEEKVELGDEDFDDLLKLVNDLIEKNVPFKVVSKTKEETLNLMKEGTIRNFSVDYINSINEIEVLLYSVVLDESSNTVYYTLNTMPIVSSTGQLKKFQIMKYLEGILITISEYYLLLFF